MTVRAAAGGLLVAAIVAVGLISALRLDWVSDDGFVSFRCARNLALGRGLVFNAGEHVESYTNFLWTLLLAGAARVGVEPEVFARFAGVASFLLVTLALAEAERRLTPRGRAFVPAAAAAWALLGHAQSFAVCGLETSFFALWITLSLIALVEASSPRRFACAGLLGVLATLTRPDGALVLVLGAFVAARSAAGAQRRAHLTAFLLPGLLLLTPYLAWKLVYYGHLIPNTFYAKSAYSPYAGQGFLYVGLYLGCYYGLIGALLGAAVLIRRRRGESLERPGWEGSRALVVLGGFTLLYLAFVVWVGGDFMFARFCLPFTPALLLIASLALASLPNAALRAACALAFAVSFALPRVPRALAEGRMIAGIAEESLFNTRARLDSLQEVARVLRTATQGTGVRVLVGGGMMSLAYYAELPFVLDTYGLTDEAIARRPLAERGRVGHEKELGVYAPYFALRKIDLALPLGGVVPRLADDLFASVRALSIERGPPGEGEPGETIPGLILCYRREIMEALARRPGVRVPSIDAWLDDYVASLPERSPARVRAEYPALRAFYFEHNPDPVRQAAVEARMNAAR